LLGRDRSIFGRLFLGSKNYEINGVAFSADDLSGVRKLLRDSYTNDGLLTIFVGKFLGKLVDAFAERAVASFARERGEQVRVKLGEFTDWLVKKIAACSRGKIEKEFGSELADQYVDELADRLKHSFYGSVDAMKLAVVGYVVATGDVAPLLWIAHNLKEKRLISEDFYSRVFDKLMEVQELLLGDRLESQDVGARGVQDLFMSSPFIANPFMSSGYKTGAVVHEVVDELFSELLSGMVVMLLSPVFRNSVYDFFNTLVPALLR
jgi:hypothetical protein